MDTCEKVSDFKSSYPDDFQPNNQDLLELSSMPMDKHMQTRMWQQNQYLTDSGIQSGNSTHTPSISSKVGVSDIEYDENVSNQKHQQQLNNRRWCQTFEPISVNPGDSNIMSPAPMSANSTSICHETSDVNGVQIASNTDLKGNKLPEIDTDEAANAIPDLVKLIKDEDDHVVLYQAAMMVFQLSKSEAIESLIDSDEMIHVIISALNRTEDLETVRFLAGTLYNVSQTQKGLKAIFAASCVPCLVKLLNSPIESVLFYAITTLHNLLLHQEGAKAVVRQSDCLQKMTSLLRKNNMKFLTICTDCLQILAYGHQESKLAILNSGGPAELVRILRSYTYEKLLWTTARVLKVLSVCTSNKPSIIQAGGMEALGRHLHHSSQRLAMNCLWTLRNMSDAATKVNNLQPLLQSLVQLLGSPDSNIVTCAAGILSNLTCNNYANKFFVFRFGGVKNLFIALSAMNAREDILEPCMCALRHLTSRHEDEERARLSVVRELCALPLLARILHAGTAGLCPELNFQCHSSQAPLQSWMLIKAMVGLLRNLSINLDNHAPMREHGLVTGLVLLLYGTIFTIQKQQAMETTQRNPNCTIVQNVRLEEIVEGICGALHMLMRDPMNRSHLATFRGPALPWPNNKASAELLNVSYNHALALFIYLLHSEQDSIQRATAGVLVEASQDRQALEVIASLPGASSRLEELVYSNNEAISTYCSAVIIRLQEERGGSLGGASIIPPPHASMETGLNTPPHASYDLMYNPALSPQPGSLSAMLGPPPGPAPVVYNSEDMRYQEVSNINSQESEYPRQTSGVLPPNGSMAEYEWSCQERNPNFMNNYSIQSESNHSNMSNSLFNGVHPVSPQQYYQRTEANSNSATNNSPVHVNHQSNLVQPIDPLSSGFVSPSDGHHAVSNGTNEWMVMN